jgi:hypothetical protein
MRLGLFTKINLKISAIMNIKSFFAIIATVIFLPFLSYGQNKEEASPYTLYLNRSSWLEGRAYTFSD